MVFASPRGPRSRNKRALVEEKKRTKKKMTHGSGERRADGGRLPMRSSPTAMRSLHWIFAHLLRASSACFTYFVFFLFFNYNALQRRETRAGKPCGVLVVTHMTSERAAESPEGTREAVTESLGVKTGQICSTLYTLLDSDDQCTVRRYRNQTAP